MTLFYSILSKYWFDQASKIKENLTWKLIFFNLEKIVWTAYMNIIVTDAWKSVLHKEVCLHWNITHILNGRRIISLVPTSGLKRDVVVPHFYWREFMTGYNLDKLIFVESFLGWRNLFQKLLLTYISEKLCNIQISIEFEDVLYV